MRVLTAEQMREADRQTIHGLGIPSMVLMENAGRQVVAAMEASFEDLSSLHVVVLAGRGNNGGDGFVVARTLRQRGVEVSVFVVGQLAELRGDARANLEILGRLGLSTVEIATEQDWELHSSEVLAGDIVVDALFGTGLREPLRGVWQTAVADLNGSGLPVVSIDLPSGLASDTPELIGDTVKATLTVTLAAPKIALVLPPAERHCGDLVVADIGIPTNVIDGLEGPLVRLLVRDRMRELVAPRPPETHKGDCGRVLVVGGSTGKTGAVHLAAMAALRSGAGLVTVATPRSVLPIVASMAAEYMTLPLPEDEGQRISRDAVDAVLAIPSDVIAVGPGLGVGPGPRDFMHALIERAGGLMVIDADGLNAFADEPERLSGRDGLDIIVTPHPGEMARLCGRSIDDVQRDRIGVARALAVSRHLHVVLKGYRTLVASPGGGVAINLTGNPGMATGGSGDVLTGVIAAWFGQLLDADAAAALGVYLHGMAGDLSEADEGEHAMIAGDLVEHLGDAVLELTARRKVRRQPAPSE